MPEWVKNVIATMSGLFFVWAMFVGVYFVAGWHEEGRGFLALLGVVAGLVAVLICGAAFIDRKSL